MRTFDAACSRMASSADGRVRTAQTRKIDSAIDSVVRRLRRGWRTRLRTTRPGYVMGGSRRGPETAVVDQDALVEPDHRVHPALGAGIVRDHHDCLLDGAVQRA